MATHENVKLQIMSLYWGYSIGGVGKYGVLLDKAAKQAGLAMQHVCIRGEAWQVDAATLSELGAEELIITSRIDSAWVRKLGSLIRYGAPELLMTHGFNGHFVARMMRALGYFRGDIISSYHGLYHSTTRGRKMLAPIYNSFTEWHIRNIQNTISVAEYSKQYLTSKGVNADRIDVIHNGIEDISCGADARSRLRKEWGITDKQIVIGIASRLDPVKGIGYLMKAYSRLVARHENIVLVLVGTGTEEERLKRDAEHLGDSVHFAGFRTDIAECLEAFDVFVLPSLAEYHSIALLEAMRAGKAIVSTDVGGNTESVRDRGEALVIKSADVAALEEAIECFINDQELRRKLGAAARDRFLAEFTEDVMLQKTGRWLERCHKASLRAKK